MKRTHLGWVVVVLLLGCESSQEADTVPYSGNGGSGYGGSGYGGSGGGYVDPTQCTKMTCSPPPCCGQPCGAGCCKGTVCGDSGKCIPESCSYCGDLGCKVDFAACTAECNKPSCCMKDCVDDSQCCSGTKCQPNTAGQKKCFPTACDMCGGMESSCYASADCSIECKPPATCGKECTGDPECGSGSKCNTFESGKKKCVPAAYDAECAACGKSCTFYGSDCHVECPSTSTGGTGATAGSGGSSGGTGGTTGTCANCCQPCATDADCCPGNRCGSKKQCVPSECGYCDYGCTFYCPAGS